MWEDPVVAEVRAIRDAYAKRFDYDLDAMARDLRAKEAKGGRPVIAPAPRKADVIVPNAPKARQSG
jgi:hypothetical protein